MTAAASSRPGAWRFRSSGATARSPASCAGPLHGPTRAGCSGRRVTRAIGDMAQFVVHDNLLAVIGGGPRRLERESDAAYRKAFVRNMQHAITRGALGSRQVLDAARPRPESIGVFVGGSRLAALTGTLDQALRPDRTVRTDIAPDLWDLDADPEELYFALLNLCRNAADAMPDGGAIIVAARKAEPFAGGRTGSSRSSSPTTGRA